MKTFKIIVFLLGILILIINKSEAQISSELPSFQLTTLQDNKGTQQYMSIIPKQFSINSHTYNSGFVGIGNTNPVQMLHLIGGNILLSNGQGNISGSNGSILFGKNIDVSQGFIHGEWGIEYYQDDLFQGLNFWKPFSATSETMNFALFLNNRGKIGVGTNDPQAKFHVQGDVFILNDLLIGDGRNNAWLKVNGPINSSSLISMNNRRMVVADEEGTLKLEDIPQGDNLGNHEAIKNLKMSDYSISYNGEDPALNITPTEDVLVKNDLFVRNRILGVAEENADNFGKLELIGGKNEDASRIEIWPGGGANKRDIKFAVYDDVNSNPKTASFQFKINLIDRLAIRQDRIVMGTSDQNIALNVNGNINAKEVKVSLQNWSDYVFEDDYIIMPLKETETYIKENKHLPGIPTISEVKERGINLGEMDALLLKKIEELTLYIIQQDLKISELELKFGK